MPSALAFIGGGLLEGVGKGLVLDGKAKRERALADLEHERRLGLEDVRQEGRRGLLDAGNKAAMERLGLNIESRETLAGEATTSRERLASEATTSREGIASKAAASRERIGTAANISREKIAGVKAEKADTSAAEKRFWDIAVEAATEDKFEEGFKTGERTINWDAVALDMDARNLPKLAATARRRALNDQKRKDRKVALPIAEERVEAMDDSFFGESDAKVFKQYGGSRTKALEAILREEIKKLEDARSGKAAPGSGDSIDITSPAAVGDDPYVGAAPPPGAPDAKQASDGFWYVPDPDRAGKFKRVQKSEATRSPATAGRRGPR